MKIFIIVISLTIVFGFPYEAYAQFDLGKKLKKKVEKRIERGVDKTIDKGLDKTEDTIENAGENKNEGKKSGTVESKSEKISSDSESNTNEYLYDRVMADGKFVATGIVFDADKSEIKIESIGTINEIVKMMRDNPDLNFSIEVHTDSDGNSSFNQKLSEERAAAVKKILVDSGVEASRLKPRGWGKAGHSRIEFVKL
jgi:outer membrane protein OmpA-like peptidoglycan-associated protein